MSESNTTRERLLEIAKNALDEQGEQVRKLAESMTLEPTPELLLELAQGALNRAILHETVFLQEVKHLFDPRRRDVERGAACVARLSSRWGEFEMPISPKLYKTLVQRVGSELTIELSLR